MFVLRETEPGRYSLAVRCAVNVVVVGGVAHDVLQGVHPADADIQLAGAKPFQSGGEPVGDLPAPRQLVVAGGVEQPGEDDEGAADRDDQQPRAVPVCGLARCIQSGTFLWPHWPFGLFSNLASDLEPPYGIEP